MSTDAVSAPQERSSRLTPKTNDRYRLVMENHTWRLAREGVDRIVYFCDTTAARIVNREADTRVFRDDRHRILALPVFDVRGKWIGDETVSRLPNNLTGE